MTNFKIKLGAVVKDNITGFAGTVTGRAEYITGCHQYLVVAKCVEGKSAEISWFDEGRLLDKLPNVEDQDKPGGPQPHEAPTK